MKNNISLDQVKHVAQLAALSIDQKEAENLVASFDETLGVIDNLSQLSLTNIEATSQVTGLENVFREDTVEEKRMFSQEQALANAKATHQGYFVVNRIIDNDQ